MKQSFGYYLDRDRVRQADEARLNSLYQQRDNERNFMDKEQAYKERPTVNDFYAKLGSGDIKGAGEVLKTNPNLFNMKELSKDMQWGKGAYLENETKQLGLNQQQDNWRRTLEARDINQGIATEQARHKNEYAKHQAIVQGMLNEEGNEILKTLFVKNPDGSYAITDSFENIDNALKELNKIKTAKDITLNAQEEEAVKSMVPTPVYRTESSREAIINDPTSLWAYGTAGPQYLPLSEQDIQHNKELEKQYDNELLRVLNEAKERKASEFNEQNKATAEDLMRILTRVNPTVKQHGLREAKTATERTRELEQDYFNKGYSPDIVRESFSHLNAKDFYPSTTGQEELNQKMATSDQLDYFDTVIQESLHGGDLDKDFNTLSKEGMDIIDSMISEPKYKARLASAYNRILLHGAMVNGKRMEIPPSILKRALAIYDVPLWSHNSEENLTEAIHAVIQNNPKVFEDYPKYKKMHEDRKKLRARNSLTTQ